MKPEIIALLAALSGVLHIVFEYKKNLSLTYVFKPLVCLLLIVMVFLYGKDAPVSYRNLILAGLFFSMLGDIFLMLEKDMFIQGLISFFIAHICYIIAFAMFVSISSMPWVLLLGLAIFGVLIWRYLSSNLGDMKLPVAGYITIICLMTFTAGAWLTKSWSMNATPAILAFAGAVWFMASDTNLAINKFKKDYKAGQFITLSTYYIAQILIAWSVLAFAA